MHHNVLIAFAITIACAYNDAFLLKTLEIIKMHAHCQYDTTGYKIYFPMYPPSLAMHSLNLLGMPATAF